jgi:translation elongation factor EF-Tu-like GTPase
MTMPPMGFDDAPLTMTVQDTFLIKGRGTVLTGQLQGNGELNVGDTLLCGGRQWQVTGIEQFRVEMTSARPGSNIGVFIADERAAVRTWLRGWTVQFEPASSLMGPQSQSAALAPRKKRWRS